jgi:hypothetical protein
MPHCRASVLGKWGSMHGATDGSDLILIQPGKSERFELRYNQRARAMEKPGGWVLYVLLNI